MNGSYIVCWDNSGYLLDGSKLILIVKEQVLEIIYMYDFCLVV